MRFAENYIKKRVRGLIAPPHKIRLRKETKEWQEHL